MNETETYADIVRELRRDADIVEVRHYEDTWDGFEAAGIYRDLADRIEAAEKRERAIADAMLAVKGKPLPHPDPDNNAPPLFAAPGSSAALREALKESTALLAVIRADEYEENVTRQISRNTDVLSAPPEPPSNAAAMREALKSILAIEGYGAPWIEAKCIAQKALEGAQCTPPPAQERPQIEQPGSAAAMRDALEFCLKKMCGYCREAAGRCGYNVPCVDGCEPLKLAMSALAALAAPARNCDRFANELDAQLAFLNDVWLISVDKDTMLEKDRFANWTEQMKTRYGRWLFAPAKGENK